MSLLTRSLLFLALTIGSAPGALAQAGSLERLVATTYARYMPLKGVDDMAILPHESLAALKKIFADDLAAAIYDDSQCVLKTNALCVLDFDILFASQDPQPRELVVKAKGPDQVDACFRDQSPAQRCMRVSGAAGVDGMRIRDILYDDGASLRSLLKLR